MKLFIATWEMSNSVDTYDVIKYVLANSFAEVEERYPSSERIIIEQDNIEIINKQ